MCLVVCNSRFSPSITSFKESSLQLTVRAVPFLVTFNVVVPFLTVVSKSGQSPGKYLITSTSFPAIRTMLSRYSTFVMVVSFTTVVVCGTCHRLHAERSAIDNMMAKNFTAIQVQHPIPLSAYRSRFSTRRNRSSPPL